MLPSSLAILASRCFCDDVLALKLTLETIQFWFSLSTSQNILDYSIEVYIAFIFSLPGNSSHGVGPAFAIESRRIARQVVHLFPSRGGKGLRSSGDWVRQPGPTAWAGTTKRSLGKLSICLGLTIWDLSRNNCHTRSWKLSLVRC